MTYSEIKEITRKLRNNPTPSEQILWRHLRRKQLEGRDFKRDNILNDLGIRVLRIKNEELQNIENVLIRIKNEFSIF